MDILYEVYSCKDCQHGFVKKRNIVTNAKEHLNTKNLLNIDLENFFDTINFGRVRGLFLEKPFNFNNEVATTLAKIVCENNKLPQGAPTSPILSNMICHTLDNNLGKYCQKHGCTYTRYADDITISSNAYKFPKQIAKRDASNSIVLGNKIIKIIEEESGFLINKSKVKLAGKMQRQEVTGIIVNEKINVKKIYIKNLRALLYNCRKYGIDKISKKHFPNLNENDAVYRLKEVIKGKLNFLKMVKGEYDKVFLKYAKEYINLTGEEIFDIDKIKETREYIEERIAVIVSEDWSSQGTIQFVNRIGAITSTHVFVNEETLGKEKFSGYIDGTFKDPILTENLSYFYYCTKAENRSKNIPFLKINNENIKSDVIKFDLKNQKKFKLNYKDKINIGDKVIIAGYGEFMDFNSTSVVIDNAEVIAERTIFGIKAKCINKKIYHGMSGGPVLNENREVIGIIYFGTNENEGINNAFIPIADVLEILK